MNSFAQCARRKPEGLAIAKRKALETGVSWDFYVLPGGFEHLMPVITSSTPYETDEALEDFIVKLVKRANSRASSPMMFLELKSLIEAQVRVTVSLSHMVQVLNTMIYYRQLGGHRNRKGHLCGVFEIVID